MTNPAPTSAVRRAARLLALTTALVVTGVSGTAVAAPPEQWEGSPGVSALRALLVLVLIPLGLFLLITLLVYLPSMKRGGSGHAYRPGEVWRNEPEWFGGPQAGVDAVDSAPRPAVGSGEQGPGRGGASGRW